MKASFLKAEAVRKAQRFIDSEFAEPWKRCELINEPGECAESYPRSVLKENEFEIYYSASNGGGCGGILIVAPHGGDEEGTVVAIQEYSGITKRFYWNEESK